MSAGFLLLFAKQFALPRNQGGIVVATVCLPGVQATDPHWPGPACIDSARRGFAQAGAVSRGFAQADSHRNQLTAGGAGAAGATQMDLHTHGIRERRVIAPGFQRTDTSHHRLTMALQHMLGPSVSDLHRPGLARVFIHQGDEQMSEPRDFDVTWREDGTATVLARLTGRSGSGAATGVKGEGNWVKQPDLASIAYQVFDESNANAEVTGGPQSVNIAGAVLDTPVTDTALWTIDDKGYNFIYDLPPTCFPTGEHIYRVEFKFVFNSGAVGWGVFRGEAKAVFSS